MLHTTPRCINTVEFLSIGIEMGDSEAPDEHNIHMFILVSEGAMASGKVKYWKYNLVWIPL